MTDLVHVRAIARRARTDAEIIAPDYGAELVGCRTIVELTGRQFRARWGAVVLLRVGSAWRSLYQRYYEGMAGGPRINMEQLKVLGRLPSWWRAGDPMP